MTARKTAVADGDITAQAERLFAGKLNDLKRRVEEGTLPIRPVAAVLQELIEGEFVLGGLLKFVGIVKLKAVGRFVVADNFKVGNVVGGRSITWVGDNFQHHYGDLVEEDVPARVVPIWELVRGSVDAPIIKLLGGSDEPRTETYLAHTFQMMELGEKGKGRLDGFANFGYKESPKDGALWVPGWNVDGGEFNVEAHSSSNPGAWRDGRRVSGG